MSSPIYFRKSERTLWFGRSVGKQGDARTWGVSFPRSPYRLVWFPRGWQTHPERVRFLFPNA